MLKGLVNLLTPSAFLPGGSAKMPTY